MAANESGCRLVCVCMCLKVSKRSSLFVHMSVDGYESVVICACTILKTVNAEFFATLCMKFWA